MSLLRLDVDDRQVVMHTEGAVCASTQELVESASFARVVGLYVDHLESAQPGSARRAGPRRGTRTPLLDLLRLLANNPLERVARTWAGPATCSRAASACTSSSRASTTSGAAGTGSWSCAPSAAARPATSARCARFSRDGRDARPAGPRPLSRRRRERHRRRGRACYRQVAAGAEVGVIAVPQKWPAPARYRELLAGIPFVRHVLMYPPLLLDPPTNTRTGQFTEVADNPLDGLTLEREQWLCYPALVGRLVVFVYFHQRFAGLGLSLANLFEVASDEEIAAGPDAVYLYGVPPAALARFGELPTVFHDDAASRLLVAAVPLEDRFGYFGYLKKMVLTLHNVAAMDRGLMPFHGAYARLVLADGRAANVLLIGDTATGKSETLEALRVARRRAASARCASSPTTWARSRSAPTARVLGYGTEIGAFVRLDDLQQGYAFGQIDRAIIMSPNRVNARVVLPVTTLEDVLHGYPVDFLLYANNYEAVDDGHPVLERLRRRGGGAGRLRDGAAMSKGTTTVDRASRTATSPTPSARRSAGSSTRRWRARRSRPRSRPACTSGSCARSWGCPARRPPALARPPTALLAASSPARAPNERSETVMTTLFESNETAWKLHRPRQGARRLRVRAQRDAHRHQRPPLGLRRDPADADPRQGRGAHADLQLLVRARPSAIIANHIVDPDPFSTDADARHLAGPLDRRAQGARRCRSRRSCAATSPGSGRKDYEKTGHGLRHRAAGRPRRGEPAARAALHAVDQGRDRRPRREHLLRRRPST